MRKRIRKGIISILYLIPLFVGTIGYLIQGESFSDALYGGIDLYSMGSATNVCNGYIEFARWTAPLVTATVVLCVLRSVWQSLRLRMHLLGREDSVAVYSDEKLKIAFNPTTKVIYPGDAFKEYAKSHILLFSSDEKNLRFYEEHKEELSEKAVYMGLRDLELGCMKEMKNVTLFDVNGSIARLLWKDIAIWEKQISNCKIVVYGDGALAQTIMATGLQRNLFSLEQKLEYYVISQRHYFMRKHHDMPLMNGDSIHYYAMDENIIWDIIAAADIVIIAEKIELDQLQTIIVRAEKASVYYYSQEEGDTVSYLAFDGLIPFGRNAEVLTDENIRKQEMVRKAVLFNEKYAEEYQGEKDWNKLSGFLKASNISSVDYGEVIAALPSIISDETIAELEHIRWCRFHYLNYWKYGLPENGQRKDPKNRVHRDLKPYNELDEEEKEKDNIAVRLWRSAGKI